MSSLTPRWTIKGKIRYLISVEQSGEPGLVDIVLVLHPGSRGFDSHRGHMSERFFRPNRPGYLHPVSSELKNSGIRVAVGDCSVNERRRWRPPYQTGKTVHPANRKRYHNVIIWLYVGLVATQHRLNITMMFAMSCRKVMLK